MEKPTTEQLTELWTKHFPHFMVEVSQFLQQSAPMMGVPAPMHTRRKWIDVPNEMDPVFHVFVRRAFHLVGGQVLENTFDVATIEFKYHRQGVLKRVLDWCELAALQNDMSCVYIESVQHDWLSQYLVKRGYSIAAFLGDLAAPNYAITRDKMLEKLHDKAYGQRVGEAVLAHVRMLSAARGRT